MKLYDELYFEITMRGTKDELTKFVRFLKSGELDDYFEVSSDYIVYGDDFAGADGAQKTEVTFTNDDIGIEISSFDPEDYLDVFCKAAKNLEVRGHFYDIDDEEYEFASVEGDSSYSDSMLTVEFNDELDSFARGEDVDDEEAE